MKATVKWLQERIDWAFKEHQHDWDQEVKDWGNRAMCLDPKAYEPNEGATWGEEVKLFKTSILQRIGEIAHMEGRANSLRSFLSLVENYNR